MRQFAAVEKSATFCGSLGSLQLCRQITVCLAGLASGPDGTITLRVTDEDMGNRSTDEFMQVPLFSRSGDTNWGRIEFRYSLHPS